MKKLLSLLFVTLLPMLSNAYDAKIDGIYYNFISENEAEVTYRLLRRASYSGVVVIPKTVTYNGKTYRVTGIGDNAFYGCTDLTSAICLFGDSLAYNKNLIENGDFSSGYNGFTSDYSYISEPGNMALYGEGKFAVGTSPRLYFEGFIEHVDHTTGTGNMLIANGSPDNRVYVWKKKVLVEKGKTYEFSTWYIKINTGGNSFKEDIEYSINGTLIPGKYDKKENDWERYYGTYTATESGEIELKIRSTSEIRIGNDFALDDIYFSEVSAYNAGSDASSIGNYAFYGCSNLTTILIDSNVSSIGSLAFAGCSKLTQFYCNSPLVPSIQNDTFDNLQIEGVTLHVPVGSVDYYNTLSIWKNFGTIAPIGRAIKYQIGSAQDLVSFASYVNACPYRIDAVLTNDIDFTAYPNIMIGSNSFYNGEFDGAGHTVKLALQRTANLAGLFGYLSGYVHDLVTEGTITTSAKFAGGIVAWTENATVERCQSRVNIVSSVNGDGSHGGIIAVSNTGSIIRDCLMSGSITGSLTTCCAGLAGWAEGTTHIFNCLVIGQFSVGTADCDQFARNSRKVVSSNNYFHGGWNAPNKCSNVSLLTDNQVKSGEACYLLNADRTGNNTVWYQTLGEDAFPVLDNSHLSVLFVEGSYVNPDYYFTITMGNTGYTTYCSRYPMDFSEVNGLQAYIASGFSPSTGKLVLTHVMEAPAGEGLLLVGEVGTYEIPYKETDIFYSNLLKGVTTATTLSSTDGNYSNFILSDGSYGIGFYNLFSTYEMGAGKAYLQLPTASVSYGKAISLIFDDYEDAVQSIDKDSRTQSVYNLQGQRIYKPKGGINIIRDSDGTTRKVMVK